MSAVIRVDSLNKTFGQKQALFDLALGGFDQLAIHLASLFDHLGKDDVVIIDQGALGAAEERLSDIGDYYDQRGRTTGERKGSYRPLKPETLYLTTGEWSDAAAGSGTRVTRTLPMRLRRRSARGEHSPIQLACSPCRYPRPHVHGRPVRAA